MMTGGWWLAAGVVMISAASCAQPQTDIVAITTEDVGPYEVVNVTTGKSLTATVCVADPAHADTVARRIVQQLGNHSFESIALDLVGPSRSGQAEVEHFVWTPRDGARAGEKSRRDDRACRAR
jgi:hypothetical protein